MSTTVFERDAPHPDAVSAALAPSRLAPYWLDGLEQPRFPAVSGRSSYDLVVVGGGYCGLWTALEAVRREPGLRVALVEARRIGWAASGRNGGFVEATISHGEANGRRRWPDEYDTLERLGHENLDEIEALVSEFGLDCDYERPGFLSVAVEPYQVAGLREAADGENHRWLDADAVRAELNSPTFEGGLWSVRESALAHPGKLARALSIAAADRGVDLFENSVARRLEASPGSLSVVTDDGRVDARRVALATNAFPSLLARYRLHTVPVYDYVLMTEPLSDAQLASIGWSNRQGVADEANQFHYYRLSADNRILWGGYDAIYHPGRRIRREFEERPQTHRMLASHFLTTFPQLEGVRFTHRWAGVIDTSTRFCAFVGSAHGGRVQHAAGFTGLGVAATRFVARVMLDRLAGERTERTELAMMRQVPPPFPPEPIATLGIQATRWSIDRADHSEGRRNVLLRSLDALGLGFDS